MQMKWIDRRREPESHDLPWWLAALILGVMVLAVSIVF